MGSSNIRDLLTAFSPLQDFVAISAGDGRIKIWDTVKGQVQTEFTDIMESEETSIYKKQERGHLSVDYTCMKWFSSEAKKKKRKIGDSFLVLGTASGDVLALDVSAGQLKWKINDCHPGGVSAVSFSRKGSCIYAAGSDGMVCQIDPMSGNLLGKFKASTKAISSMSVSPDGNILATAAGRLRIFNCSNVKKIQKFSGHPGAVRCLIFSEDSKYVLSSAVGERYVAIWNIGGSKSVSCVLAMEHPAVFLDSRCIHSGEDDNAGLCVLAISEIGVCYLWFGQNVDELRNTKPTKISISSEDISLKSHNAALPTIFAAILRGFSKPASGKIFVAYGQLVKPSFEKILLHSGTDIELSTSHDGVLLPMSQYLSKSKKGQDVQNRVIALDRANAEDALLPIPKILDPDRKSDAEFMKSEDDMVEMELDTEAICIEDRLRSLGILSKEDNSASKSKVNSNIFNGVDLKVNMPQKKMKAVVLSKIPDDAYKLLGVLVAMWQSRLCSGKHVLPWIYSILVNHSHYVVSQEPATQLLNSLVKVAKSRGAAIQPLLQLSGRLQLLTAQINKATQAKTQFDHEHQMDETDDDDVDEILYREEEEEESELSSDNDE
ncbi:uncharacterized protein LOC107433202 [Ziziphus jujuba]|uniref:Uncharacterized protein LOC107433202 n=1 Tax=Ziziphus jujuba TaxID=326968 RepID=A0ABM3I633_ZIZJJ|nr:uncharacterized protein LOC107433202 [Ziziphus jujuba]